MGSKTGYIDRSTKAIALAVLVITGVLAIIVLPPPLARNPTVIEAAPGHRDITDTAGFPCCYDPEVEAEYPGGISAWRSFLAKAIHYPDSAIDKNIEGTIRVQFIIGKDGRVSGVKAVSGPLSGGLREEAARVIESSGKWIPAQVGTNPGHPVLSYKIQPVVFKLDDGQ